MYNYENKVDNIIIIGNEFEKEFINKILKYSIFKDIKTIFCSYDINNNHSEDEISLNELIDNYHDNSFVIIGKVFNSVPYNHDDIYEIVLLLGGDCE